MDFNINLMKILLEKHDLQFIRVTAIHDFTPSFLLKNLTWSWERKYSNHWTYKNIKTLTRHMNEDNLEKFVSKINNIKSSLIRMKLKDVMRLEYI